MDGRALGQTRLCARPGCDAEAERGGELCTDCLRREGRTAERTRGELPPRYACRTKGCEGLADSLAGRYAYCPDCQVARGTRKPEGSVRWSTRADTPDLQLRRRVPGSHTPPGRLETAALELCLAGRRVDRALVAVREAREEAAAAISSTNHAARR